MMPVQKILTNDMNEGELFVEGQFRDLETDAEARIEVVIEVPRDMGMVARARVQERDTLAHEVFLGIDPGSPHTLVRDLESPDELETDLVPVRPIAFAVRGDPIPGLLHNPLFGVAANLRRVPVPVLFLLLSLLVKS